MDVSVLNIARQEYSLKDSEARRSIANLTSIIGAQIKYAGLCVTPLSDGATTSPISVKTASGTRDIEPTTGTMVVYRPNNISCNEFIFANGVWTDIGVFRIYENFSGKSYDFSQVGTYFRVVEDLVRMLEGGGIGQMTSHYDFSHVEGYFQAIEEISSMLGATVENTHYLGE